VTSTPRGKRYAASVPLISIPVSATASQGAATLAAEASVAASPGGRLSSLVIGHDRHTAKKNAAVSPAELR